MSIREPIRCQESQVHRRGLGLRYKFGTQANGFLKTGLNEIAEGATIEKGQSPRTLQTSEVGDEKSVRD